MCVYMCVCVCVRDLKLEAHTHTTPHTHTQVSMNADTGEIQIGVEEFGKRKSAFNPVYDEAEGIEGKMQAAAQSPAELGFNM